MIKRFLSSFLKSYALLRIICSICRHLSDYIKAGIVLRFTHTEKNNQLSVKKEKQTDSRINQDSSIKQVRI